MALSAPEIRIAGVGHVYVAPTGTTAPTDVATTLPVAWKELGYTTIEGVDLAYSVTQNEIKSWQARSPVRYFNEEVKLTAKFMLQQWNKNTVPFYFGGGATAVNGSEWSYQISQDPSLDERSMVIEWNDGSKKYRVYIPRGLATSRDNLPITRTGEIKLGLEFEAIIIDDVTPLATLLTNDSNLAP